MLVKIVSKLLRSTPVILVLPSCMVGGLVKDKLRKQQSELKQQRRFDFQTLVWLKLQNPDADMIWDSFSERALHYHENVKQMFPCVN